MAVTIKQIAQMAGVAPTTVSLVLKDSKKVGAATKQRVLKIVEKMDYFPNISGKLLKQGRTDTIAVLSSYFHGIFKMDFMTGVESAVYGSSYRLGQFYAEQGNESLKLKEILLGIMADAVICISIKPDMAILEKLRAAGKHIILVEETATGFPGISFDNYSAARLAVSHLKNSGRKRIALSIAELKSYGSYKFVSERLRGYKSAIKDFNLEYSEIVEIPSYSYDYGRTVLDRLMEKGPLPDAIFFASGDLTAAGFMKEAQIRGIKIPQDIAVIGFDDSIIAQVTTPGLTTIRQPGFEMGKTALKLAVSILENKETDASKIIEFKPQLVIRESA